MKNRHEIAPKAVDVEMSTMSLWRPKDSYIVIKLVVDRREELRRSRSIFLAFCQVRPDS